MEEGSLEAALAQAKGQKDVDVHVLKQEAATALLQAAQDGSLEKAFAEVKSEPQQELESLRMAAAETLLKAAVDGSLEQALRAAPRSGASGITSAGTSELGDLATDLVHAACQAAETPQGPLSVVFSQEPVDEDSLSKATKPGDQGKDIEAIRQAAARSLLKAAEANQLFISKLAKPERIAKALPQAIMDTHLAIEDTEEENTGQLDYGGQP
ncbi:unnamed protein product [Symbiodinium necroappetens]|uniref:Uncharacterized protein n=1 Tax=Symbiodinium necroappetens TaxID=1628268 RepID=A0A812P5U3_9DINO|nr:unnamed protein product [Symbiodinium necroappetens]